MKKNSRKTALRVSHPVKSLRDRGAPASSWLASFGAALALGPLLFRYAVDPDPFGADHRALQSDWSTVGDDVLTAARTLDS